MTWTSAQIAVFLIGILHIIFMIFELFPWEYPFIMNRVLEKWPQKLHLSVDEKHFVAMVVHNAGIYNGIVAVGLWATLVGRDAFQVQVALLMGGVVAGLFGAVTLTK